MPKVHYLNSKLSCALFKQSVLAFSLCSWKIFIHLVMVITTESTNIPHQ